MLEFLSGGYYRAAIHRVVNPPSDQQGVDRLGFFYFAVASDHVKLDPLVDSPVLKQVGITSRFPAGEAPTAEQWRRARTAAYGTTVSIFANENKSEEIQEEELLGTKVKHWN
jgi:isopenicillin N synthase-like dioxygenase